MAGPGTRPSIAFREWVIELHPMLPNHSPEPLNQLTFPLDCKGISQSQTALWMQPQIA